MSSQRAGDLLIRAMDGDQQALGTLLEHYRPYLRILARRHLDPVMSARVDPSDLVQQTCFEACRDLPKFRGQREAELIAWLRRILENNARNSVEVHIRAQKRSVHREKRVDPAPGDEQKSPVDHAATTESSPSRRAMRGEQAVRLAHEIESLPEDQSEAIRLRHIEGWTLRQLAAHFQRSESAVAGLIKRGLRSLRRRLADLL